LEFLLLFFLCLLPQDPFFFALIFPVLVGIWVAGFQRILCNTGWDVATGALAGGLLRARHLWPAEREQEENKVRNFFQQIEVEKKTIFQ